MDLANAHLQRGIALTTIGSLQGNASAHTQARQALLTALNLQPSHSNLHTRARLGFVEGGRLLQLWQPCVDNLRPIADAMDGGQHRLLTPQLLEQAITTLDGCLTRLGWRAAALEIRQRAARAGVYRSTEQQNAAAVVSYPGMRSQPWWEAADVSPAMLAVQPLPLPLPLLPPQHHHHR